MLTVREFLSGIKRDYVPDIDTQDLVRYLDRLQRQVFLPTDNSRREWINGADPEFVYPTLVTTAGVFEYTLTENILLDSLGNPISIVSPTGAPEEILSVLSVFKRIRNTIFEPVPCKKFDRVGLEEPKILFTEDPGDTQGTYYVSFTTAPVRITTVNSPCSIDLSTFEEMMTDGMVGMIERTRNGESTKWDIWEKVWVGKIRQYYNRNDDEYYDMTIGYNY